MNDHEDAPHCLALTNQCRRICLQAGADPTLARPKDNETSLVAITLDVGTTVNLSNCDLDFTAANGGEGNATDPFGSRERVYQHGL